MESIINATYKRINELENKVILHKNNIECLRLVGKSEISDIDALIKEQQNKIGAVNVKLKKIYKIYKVLT